MSEQSLGTGLILTIYNRTFTISPRDLYSLFLNLILLISSGSSGIDLLIGCDYGQILLGSMGPVVKSKVMVLQWIVPLNYYIGL